MTAAAAPGHGRALVAVNALWVAVQFQDAALLAIVVPTILLRVAPGSHTTTLAILATLGALAVAIVPPIAGTLSDRARRRGADRRPQTAMALAVDALALIGIALASNPPGIAIALVAAVGAQTSAITIYQALLPEVVPRASWGLAVGIRGALTLLGTIAGLLICASLGPPLALVVMAALVLAGAATMVFIPIATPVEHPRLERAVARGGHDLRVAAAARGCFSFGIATLNTFIFFFLRDALHVKNPGIGTGLIAAAALVGAIASSIAAGVLSDRVERKYVAAAAGVPMVLAAVGFAILPDPRAVYGFAVLFGLGFGAVFSVGWALALDAIPALGDVARDLGWYGTLSNLPGIVGPAIGGLVLAHAPDAREGYRALFLIAGGAFAAGSLWALDVGRRPRSPWWSAALLALTVVVRRPIIVAHVRVRQWGRLPFRRGPTLLLANHQHEDESEIVVERAFAGGPWSSPIFTAGSRRIYEPGFFAERLPALARVAYGLDGGPLMRALGMFPLENQLAARPLRSIARAVRARHGDLPLGAVLDPAALAEIAPVPATLADLDRPGYVEAARRETKLARLRSPYREEALADVRAQVDADLAAIADVVRRGGTFFATPEGFYSTDGRMRPLKGIVRALAPLATVWLAAIAFDPFRGRRLSLLYRVVRPAFPDDLGDSLRAARPVTTSAVLASWLVEQAEAFTAAEARAGVLAGLRALPRGAFVDPELVRAPEARVDEALRILLARGTLARAGETLRRGATPRDPRFPGVADIVAYQAAFHAETVAAAARLP